MKTRKFCKEIKETLGANYISEIKEVERRLLDKKFNEFLLERLGQREKTYENDHFSLIEKIYAFIEEYEQEEVLNGSYTEKLKKLETMTIDESFTNPKNAMVISEIAAKNGIDSLSNPYYVRIVANFLQQQQSKENEMPLLPALEGDISNEEVLEAWQDKYISTFAKLVLIATANQEEGLVKLQQTVNDLSALEDKPFPLLELSGRLDKVTEEDVLEELTMTNSYYDLFSAPQLAALFHCPRSLEAIHKKERNGTCLYAIYDLKMQLENTTDPERYLEDTYGSSNGLAAIEERKEMSTILNLVKKATDAKK